MFFRSFSLSLPDHPSHLWRQFEAERYRVERVTDAPGVYEVIDPAIESRLLERLCPDLPLPYVDSWFSSLSERTRMKVREGKVEVRWDYFTPRRLLLHLALAAPFLGQIHPDQPATLALAVVAQFFPAVMLAASARKMRRILDCTIPNGIRF